MANQNTQQQQTIKTELKMSKKPLQLIWNGTERKVSFFAIEAMNLKSKKNESIEAYLKITSKNANFKTKTAHKTPNPYWGEFFFFTPSGSDMSSSVTFSVWNNKIIDRCLGQFSIKLADLERERVYDMWCDIVPRSEKSKDQVAGKVHIRMYISFMKESVPEGRTNQFHQFNYEPYLPSFKTGDLIIFGGVGALPSLIKLYTNSEYSSLGIVVSLPNKYTEKEELHVVEVTRNIDALFDPFADLPKIGLSIFRLTERIHQFHGNGIWWCPITPLAAHEEAHLKSKMWALWTAIDPFEAFKRSYPEINTFLFQQFRVGRHVWDVCELYSPNVIASIIRETGLEMNIGETALTVTDIVNQEIFQTPLPIRVQKLQIPFTHSSTEPSWKTPSLNSSNGAMDSQSQLNPVNGAGSTQLTPEMAADLQANPDLMQHPAFLQAVAQHQQHLQQQAHALMMMQQHPSQVQQQGYYPYMMPVPYPAFSSSGSRLRALIPELNIAPENPEFPGSEPQPTNYFGNDTTVPPLETGTTLEQVNGSRSSSDADSTPTAADTPLSDSLNNLSSITNNTTLSSSGNLNKPLNNASTSPPSKTPTVIPGGDSGALASSILHSNLTRPTGGTRSSTLPRPSPSAPTPTSTPASSISGLSLSSTLPPVPFTQTSPRSSSTSQLPTTQTPSSSSPSISTLKVSLGPSKPKTPPAPKFHTLPHPPSSGPSGAPVSTLTLPRPKPALPPKPANLPVTRNLESSSNGE